MGDPDVQDWERLRKEIPAIDEEVPDPVNSPNHYLAGSIECIDAIEASASSADAFRGYCKGNVQKYLWRMEHKGKPKEDAMKAQWYLNKLISKL
jgi:hypothetical protein|tara:strand:+ start:1242 stop:1523 length:282 start_codon:yes stop_codon:yes gene_type:complete